MTIPTHLLGLVLLAAAPRGGSETVRLPVTRDLWLSDVGKEADGNNGGAPQLKLKSYQEMSIVDFDPAPLRGRTVIAASLHLRLSGPTTLKRVTVGTISAPWVEGTGRSYAAQPGSSTFRREEHPDVPWTPDGGDLCRVILGQGGTVWGMADASAPDADGWQSIPVDPGVIAARVAGVARGFLVFDDTGTEWTRDGETYTVRHMPNRFVYSRDQNAASAPYFTATLGPEDRVASLRPGGGPVRIPGPAGGRGGRFLGHPARLGPGGRGRLPRHARRPPRAATARPDPRRARRSRGDAPPRPRPGAGGESRPVRPRRGRRGELRAARLGPGPPLREAARPAPRRGSRRRPPPRRPPCPAWPGRRSRSSTNSTRSSRSPAGPSPSGPGVTRPPTTSGMPGRRPSGSTPRGTSSWRSRS